MNIDTINPKWIGNEPAWDITVNGDVFEKDVKAIDVIKQMREAHKKGFISDFNFQYGYADRIIRKFHIEAYVKSKIN